MSTTATLKTILAALVDTAVKIAATLAVRVVSASVRLTRSRTEVGAASGAGELIGGPAPA
jgi:hypothetical protein